MSKNDKKSTIRRIITLILVFSLVIPFYQTGSADAAKADDGEKGFSAMKVDAFTRQTLNFNREWKFVRKDIAGAEYEDYNDSTWYNVGLPHDFSIPYWQEEKHYTGYGWYRKTFDVPATWAGKRLNLSFDGVFHTAEVYVNGELAGSHEGGYTGFNIDITDQVRTGKNVVAVRVNNLWRNDLAPRAGEHMFTGGIYRDVNLVVTSPVHVTWYGTFVQTPDIDTNGSDLRMQAEVANESGEACNVKVEHKIYDADNNLVKTFGSDTKAMSAGEVYNFDDTSDRIDGVNLWSPDDPYMYKVITDVLIDGVSVDQFESPLGFRWVEWTADQGFFINGEHFWIDGTNAHQDHAGWANAVSRSAIKRDVSMIKEAGFNFVRGSHYPHSPYFASSCDELGVLFWSEAPFWCTSAWGEGSTDGTSDDYKCDGYPSNGNKATEEAFEQSCVDALSEMIHINRNHPSIIIWCMGNEPFFGDNANKKKALISKMAGKAKELDPTRATAIGGTQRGGFDHLANVDVAGYNGDGADIAEYQNPGVANMVSEYSSHTANRPDRFARFYGSVQTDSNGEAIRYPWRSGIALWCTFHHGSILSRSYGDMGCVDYYRLPLNIWYYYRYMNTGEPAVQSTKGTPAKLALSASDYTITDDGLQDTHIIVTVEDENGTWVDYTPEVTLEVVEGPGIFPTGKTMTFKPGDGMRDGKAAIEFRSYYAGNTKIRAYSASNPEIAEAEITISTSGAENTIEPDISTMYGAFMSNGGIVPNSLEEAPGYKYVNYRGCPIHSSSRENTRELIYDGSDSSGWVATTPGSDQWIYGELEHGGIYLYKAKLSFNGKRYPYAIQCKRLNLDEGDWETIKEYDSNTIAYAPEEESFGGEYMRYIRIVFKDVPAGEYANLAELKLYGLRADRPGYKTGEEYLSDIKWGSTGIPGTYADTNAGLSGAVMSDQIYNKCIGIKSSTEAVYDLEKYADRYCRFRCIAGVDDKSTAKGKFTLSIYADDELIYERTIDGSAKETADIDVNINKVKKLKIKTSSDQGSMYVDLGNARFTGAMRDLSIDGSAVSVKSYSSMETLDAGRYLNVSTYITNNTGKTGRYCTAVTVYDANGNVVETDMKDVEAGTGLTKRSDMRVVVANGTTIGAFAKIVTWDNTFLDDNNLVPVCEIVKLECDPQKAAKSVQDMRAFAEDSVVTIDGKDTRIEKVGTWKYWDSNQAYNNNETYIDSGFTGSYMSLDFKGYRVIVAAKKDGSQKGAKIYIDGQLVSEVDTYQADDVYTEVYDSGLLTPGDHTIRIEPTGKFGLDYIRYYEGEPEDVPEPGKPDDPDERELDPNINYTELEGMIGKALEVIYAADANKYTAESRVGFSDCLVGGAVVHKNINKTQLDVDRAALMINTQLAALKIKPTSYGDKTVNKDTGGMNGAEFRPHKGAVYTLGGLKYKVLTVSSGKKGTVSVTGPAKSSTRKSLKKLTIPLTIKLNGYTLKVIEVASKAFRKFKKLKKVTIGKNVTRIGKNAFNGCSKLADIIVKSKKIKSVGRKAFTGIAKKATFTFPKKKFKNYKNKVFKGKGQSKKAKYKKK